MKAPIDGMKVNPYGEGIMLGAWLDFVHHMIGKPDIRAIFNEGTGLDLDGLLNRTPIEKAIDEATGHDRETLIGFCDWVTENFWGTEDGRSWL